MRLVHWLFRSRKKKCKHCCLFCKYYHECNPNFNRKERKLNRIDEKIKRTTKKLDRHIEEYKRIADTMR